MNGLHVTARGCGPDVVLVHGWGFDGRVLQPLAERLAARFRVHSVDLPGHGRSPGPLPASLPELAAQLAAALPSPAAWIGWSLGALAGWQAALDRPDAVTRLVAIAASPRFTRAADWPDAVDPALLEQFVAAFAAAPGAALERFTALVAHGDRWQREVHRLLSGLHDRDAAIEVAALTNGLALLAGSDLRAALAGLDVPVLCLLGEADALVPAGVTARLASDYPGWAVELVEGAGHAPFTAHANRCSERIGRFLDG
jgi:pimeloyl-[acyl-carrier protein] methyl ester esterase